MKTPVTTPDGGQRIADYDPFAPGQAADPYPTYAHTRRVFALEQVSLRLPGIRLCEIDSYAYMPSTLFHDLESLHLTWKRA